jgi:Outer membrane protein beta-barrel domain
MSIRRMSLVLAGLALLASPAAAQDRAVVFQVLGGGYNHLANLSASGPEAHFKTGFALGGAVGVHLNQYLAVHADFTFARNQARGALAFAGDNVDRYFYGGHLELRYPVTASLSPFLFGGAGGVTVSQRTTANQTTAFTRFTKPAGMFGAGLSYLIPGAPVELLAEGKALTYKWDAAGFNRMQWDVTYSLGFAYRLHF